MRAIRFSRRRFIPILFLSVSRLEMRSLRLWALPNIIITLVGGNGKSAKLNRLVERCPGPSISKSGPAIDDSSPTEKLSIVDAIVGLRSPQEFCARIPWKLA